MPLTATYDIFMDGSCSFCRWSQAKIEPHDSGSRLRFLDYNDPVVAAQAPFSRLELDNEMHVRTPEGAWLKGFEAWLALLRVLPKLAWLGRLASMPPMRWIGPSAYAFIARHRVTAFPERRRAVRAIRARFLGAPPSDARAPDAW